MPIGDNMPARLAESAGTVFYVSTSGSDANPGTSSLPWLTVNKALQTLTAGQKALVRAGTYNEGDLTVNRGGSAGNTITIEADDPSNRPVILGRINLTSSSAAFWRFRNLINDANATFSSCWKPTSSANNIEWYRCESRNTAGSGGGWLCTQSGTNNLQWWSCISHDNAQTVTGAHGWYFNGGHHYYCMNCISRDNGGYGFHMFTDTGQTLNNCFFYNCVAADSRQRAGFIISGDSVTVNTASLAAQDCHFYNCVSVFNNGDVGSNRYGWYIHFAGFSDYTGYVKNTLDNCVSFGNSDGDLVADNALASVINTAFLTGTDPLFVDRTNNNYHLQAGTPGRAEPARLRANTFEGGTNAVAVSSGNSGGASGDAFNTVTVGSGNTFIFDNTAGRITQTLGGKWTWGGTAVGGALWTGLGSLTAKTWFRTTFAVSAIPTVGSWLGFIQLNDSSGNRCAMMNLRTDGKIQATNAAGTAITASTSTVALAAATLYRLELAVTPGTGTAGIIEWWLYSSAGASYGSFINHNVTSGLALGANIDQLQIGLNATPANVSGLSGWYDDLAISTVDQLGPRGGYPDTTNTLINYGVAVNTPIKDFEDTTRANPDAGAYAFIPVGGGAPGKPRRPVHTSGHDW